MTPDEATVRDVGSIWRELHGGLWHTTHPERFLGILKHRAISPEPEEIPNSERWGTSAGPVLYPYVRAIGGVSLFDFQEFDPQSYQSEYPFSTWREFVPFRRAWGGAVWIEIDRESISHGFLSGRDLLTKWKSSGELGRKIMPLIEATHIGPVPVATFKRVLFIRALDGQFYQWRITDFDQAAYDRLLSEWREDSKTRESKHPILKHVGGRLREQGHSDEANGE